MRVQARFAYTIATRTKGAFVVNEGTANTDGHCKMKRRMIQMPVRLANAPCELRSTLLLDPEDMDPK